MDLTSPIQIGKHTVKNRIVVPPMVVTKLHRDGRVTPELLSLYGAFADSGSGIIVQEATCVLPEGKLAGEQLGLWADWQIDDNRRIVDRCKATGALMLVQIHYASTQGEPDDVVFVGPSEYTNGDGLHRALTLDEVVRIRDGFVTAAQRAERAGYDGVELHGAHGYLLCAFTNPKLNRRADRYGDHLQLVREIYEGIRQSVRSDFLVTIRTGVDNPTMAVGLENCLEYERMGFDLLNVSSGMEADEVVTSPEEFPFSALAWRGAYIKKHVKVPVIAVGGLDDPAMANRLIAEGWADFAAVGKAMLTDPHWAAKALENDPAPLIPCLHCSRCQWFGDHTRCPAYRKAVKAGIYPLQL